ncbi:2,5-dioxovalerate dehydrogenase [Chlorella sorokiniana]|uniref:2,5-dioxovalerate dehydrogenase n=1 Tax=Chlorella sorokiniana TaxID=3076 RepID=A0A2P6TY55_CHLSO|nr:2,5-dioxovalerate dehydrogenase [Chlorella sorokiniana]|eukprot:PRW58996.1 2,5-dioxovalerate dehydrogenase [Chlorella sorokiniana]
MADEAALERMLRNAANRKAPGCVGTEYLERRLRRACALPPEQRGPDAQAFLEPVQLLREEHQLLPLTRKGAPALPATPATAKRAARGMLLHIRAQLISPYITVSELKQCPHICYLRLVRKVRQTAMWTTGREGLPDALLETVLVSLTALEHGCELEDLQQASHTAACVALPDNEAALRTALQQHTITGSGTPLLTLEQLQLACHHLVVQTISIQRTKHARVTQAMPHANLLDRAGLQAKALTPAQQNDVEAAYQRSMGAILRIAPDSPKSQQAAARALMYELKDYATLVQHCLACHDLAVRSNDGFFKSLHDKAQTLLPSLEGQLQAMQRTHWHSEADVRSAAAQLRDQYLQAFQEGAAAGVPVQQLLFCTGPRPACFRKHWPIHKLVCKPVAGSTSSNSTAAAEPGQPSGSQVCAPALLHPKLADSKGQAANCQAPNPSPLASSSTWNRACGTVAAAAEPAAASSICAADKPVRAAEGAQFSPAVAWASQPLDRSSPRLLLGLLLLLGLAIWLMCL